VGVGALGGNLTGTVHGDVDDPWITAAVATLARHVGRLIYAGVPTGVAVVRAMHHGGPYPATTDVDPSFPDMWCAALSHSMSRFEDCRGQYKMARSGGVGAFTADNFPVFDYMAPNVYVAADSNHGYKMIAVGKEIAEVLGGGHSSLLYPFRYERFATGDLHPVSHSPYPWS